MDANDRLELLTVVGQGIVLSAGFALVFSWDATFSPKALSSLVLVLLVLIYPMPDRLKNVIQRELREVRKTNSLTQTLILELRESLSKDFEEQGMSSDEKLAKAQEIANLLESLRSDFDKEFDEAFGNQRVVSGPDWLDFLGNTLAIVVYLIGLVGGSASVGWLISLTL